MPLWWWMPSEIGLGCYLANAGKGSSQEQRSRLHKERVELHFRMSEEWVGFRESNSNAGHHQAQDSTAIDGTKFHWNVGCWGDTWWKYIKIWEGRLSESFSQHGNVQHWRGIDITWEGKCNGDLWSKSFTGRVEGAWNTSLGVTEVADTIGQHGGAQ